MARIMAHYRKSTKQAQVIGLTAAPASKSSTVGGAHLT